MCSCEDRMKAVQLYIESDFSKTLVFNTLGYPSPNMLLQWFSTVTMYAGAGAGCR